MNFSSEFMKRCKDWAIWVFIVSMPIFYVPMADPRFVQEKYFQAATMVLAALFFGNIWITLFIWLNIFLWVQNGVGTGASQVFSCFLFGLLFSCARTYFRMESIKRLTTPMVIVAILSILFMIPQLFGVDPFTTVIRSSGQWRLNETFNRPVGLFKLECLNGIYLSMTAAILFFTSPLLAIFLAIPIAMSKSSAAFLAYASLFIFWANHTIKHLVYGPYPTLQLISWKRRLPHFRIIWKRWTLPVFWIVAMTVVFGATYGAYRDYKTDPLTFRSRFENWHLVIRSMGDRPFGYGPDSFRNMNKHKRFMFFSDEDYNPGIASDAGDGKLSYRYYPADNGKWEERFKGREPKWFSIWNEAHNEYIQYVFEYGYLGMILLFFFAKECYDRYKLSNRSKETMMLTGILIVLAASSITQFPFHLARITGIFGLILGAYFSITDENYLRYKEA